MLTHSTLRIAVSVFLLTFCLCLFPSGAAEGIDETAAGDDRLSQCNFAFGCDLYKTVSKDQGNLFFSPHSVSNALAIVLAGAKGDTAKEIAKVLGTRDDPRNLHDSFARLNKRVQSATHSGKTELLVANAFWRHDGLALRPTFVEECARNYDVEFRQSDFVNNSEGARLSINEWVEVKTKDKIKELFKAGSVNDKTRFVLVNAVYFKGKWSVPFNKKLTKEEDFLAGFKERVRVPTMKQKLITGYHSSDGLQVVAIPYADNRLSLYAFMGENETAFRTFESRFSPRVVNDLLGRLKKHVVDVSIPKFLLEEEIPLNEPLRRLGISAAFSVNADLSGITDSREKLSVGTVIHKSYLDLNEEGTEAAAVTGVVGVTPISSSQPIPSAEVVLDRPFLFLIRDNETGAVLFLGRLMNP